MPNYLTTSTDLASVANAIRAKAGTSGHLTFPLQFVNTIDGLQVGDDCDATTGDILSGKTAVVNRQKIMGTIPSKSAETIYPNTSEDKLIAAGKYLAGNQVIKKVVTSGLDAANIKHGVAVKVGDADDDDRIFGATGSFTSDGTATDGDILSGKIAYSQGQKRTGNIVTKAGQTYYPSTSADQKIDQKTYVSGDQVFKKLITSGLSAGNIKHGVSVKVGDADDDDRIFGATGSFTSDGTATDGDILSGKIAYSQGQKRTGSIQSKAAETFYPSSSSDRTISSGQYLSGNQVIKKVTYSGLSPENIKSGVTVMIGDVDDPDRIISVPGSFQMHVDEHTWNFNFTIPTGITTEFDSISYTPGGTDSFFVITHAAMDFNSDGALIDEIGISGHDIIVGVKRPTSSGSVYVSGTIKVLDIYTIPRS